MAISGGLGSSLGISVAESTFGTYVAPTRWLEFNNESFAFKKNVVQGKGLKAGGTVGRTSRRVVPTTEVQGDFEFDIPNRGFGLPLAHAMGSYPTASTGTYTFTLGNQDTKSFTLQVGASQTGGTVTPKNVTGCKVTSWTLSVPNAGIATMKMSVDAQKYEISTALASPSYTAAYSAFHFAQASISVAGTTVANIRDFNLTVENNLKVDRFNLSSSGLKSAPVHNDFRKVTGSLTAEFTDTTLLTSFNADTSFALVVTLTNGTEIIAITLPAVYLNDGNHMVGGPSTIDIPFTFEALDNTTVEPLTIVYTTADASL